MTDLIVVQRSPIVAVANGPAVPVPHGASHGPNGTDELVFTDPYQTALGQIGENFNLQSGANNTASSNAVEYFVAIKLLKGVTVSKLTIMSTAVGTAPTLLKMGLRDKTASRVAVSADQKATDNASGKRTFTLLSTVTPAVTDLYYATFLWTGGAGLSLVRGLALSVDVRNPGATIGPFAFASGRSDIDAGIVTPSFSGTPMLPFWVAWG